MITMKNMKKKIELPLVEPLYSTYHYQGACTAILITNPSICNWYLNEVMMLTCTSKFLKGFTSPEINIANSSWSDSPCFYKKSYNMQFLEGYTNFVIKKLLDEGYYVYFCGIDDYYVEGKSWYHKCHFDHDGCICGYDQETKTYCFYAYDQNWIYRKFWSSQKSFEAGRKALFRKGHYGSICGLKPKEDQIAFSHEIALKKIEEYLELNTEIHPENDIVSGIVVHDYIAKYVGKLYDESIPYEKMDRRVFRLIWEHKKVMGKRIKLIEAALSLDHSISDAYGWVIREADNCRMLYASHHMKPRNSILPIIQKKLLSLKDKEKTLLEKLIEKSK